MVCVQHLFMQELPIVYPDTYLVPLTIASDPAKTYPAIFSYLLDCIHPDMDKLNFTKCDSECHTWSRGNFSVFVPGMDSAIVQQECTPRGQYFFYILSSTIKIHYSSIWLIGGFYLVQLNHV